ncbi:MAG: crossover junction endodeoxyribonuclease RuvC [Rhodospirillales bacterium 12-54-5]|nr:MAG: crossover junction endodeoxyribonuclease RuvC [Rhodospirillales bacterium 12-54-5]
MKTRRIIGIDPGLVSAGWGIIDCAGSQLSFIGCGTINPSPKLGLAERLLCLHHDLAAILLRYAPTEAALEETFVTANGSSTLKLGQARGALLVTLATAGLGVAEYATRTVKKAIVGTGTADKHQMGQMVSILLPASRESLTATKHDAADALAIAICHANHSIHR